MNPTITEAFEDTGNTTESPGLIAAADQFAAAITAAEAAGKFGNTAGSSPSTTVHDQLQEEFVDLCEKIGKNLTA